MAKKIDELHNLGKNKNKDKSKEKTKYVAVVFPTLSPDYKNKRYYYKTKKSFKVGEKVRVVTGNSPNVEVTIMNPDVKKRPRRKLIREIK